jgi:adiponectin receptor
MFMTIPVPVYYTLQSQYTTASTADIVVFSTFFFGMTLCLVLSAT